MTRLTTKSLAQIEKRMDGVDKDSIRYRILESAKNFKTSWLDLGEALFSVWKEKLFKEWGYMTFDAYTAKELGIKKGTALKLLKSYYFLEKEEPLFLRKEGAAERVPALLPSYEAVNQLRLAKNKKELDRNDYDNLRKGVFEMGKDAREVRRDISTLLKQREALSPKEARETKRLVVIKRLVATLKALRTDAETSKLLPAAIIKETSNLISRIEREL